MKIAVINSGSSSIKFKLFLMPSGEVLAQMIVEKIAEHTSKITLRFKNETKELHQHIANHHEGLKFINSTLKELHIVEHFSSLDAIAHRVVHGGDFFQNATLIDGAAIQKIKEFIPLAPLHNPSNLEGILVTLKKAPNVPQIAVFDTAFHATMPREAYLYALPLSLYEKHKIRRYGFHGTSHAYVMQEVAKEMGKSQKALNIITLHLGGGSSACAIKAGKSIDTSMGFTPLEGLMMGTRSGDIDPAIILYLQRELGFSIEQVDKLLNKESGLLGVCGEIDVREIQKKDDEHARTAIEMMARRAKKYIGAYIALLGRVDAIALTAGIGENSSLMREKILQDLELLGIELDKEANSQNSKKISKPNSKIEVFVVKTDEELQMAREASVLVANSKGHL
ncbi:MAG: acetate kinase [Sulfurimonas sp.]|uniref:acetate/propionate family kinase n=1 Tax=Sulfurimonas sp. TaxID=2022749 RepID=UPI0026291879|nr:acetate kinase [Sulfurimonas sp.]MDD2651918.1 acetate kinase [Sulfurimonas sp.]MDD3451765.1 acetate kinase [Sulfurimonas sp.]